MFSSIPLRLLAAVSFLCSAVKAEDKFDRCKQRIQRIQNGTQVFNTTYNGVFRTIDNDTIEEYLYRGHVEGMNPDFERTSRQSFLTVTTEGCKVLCEDPIDWFWASDISLILGIVSNWVLPIIALLAALPYDSDASTASGQDDAALGDRETRWKTLICGRLDGSRARWLVRSRAARSVWALLNWLGSPQTALTATFFNIWQICQSFKVATEKKRAALETEARVPFHEETPLGRLKIDAYYVLCCVGQFEFPLGLSEDPGGGQENEGTRLVNLHQSQRTSNNPALATQEPEGGGGQTSGGPNRNSFNQPQATDNTPALAVENCNGFLGILVYGLLRPICDDATLTPVPPRPPLDSELREDAGRARAREMTTTLLKSVAFQMRTLRRQGLYIAFGNILVFFIAFVVSAVLAFADIGQRTTAHSLAFGMFIGWLPLLILFAILDRNPISAARTSDLLSRWMWNVRAIREWEAGGRFDEAPQWWSKEKENAAGPNRLLRVSDFVGQGRQAGYNGVAFAVLDGLATATGRNTLVDPKPIPLDRLDEIAGKARHRVQNRRPPTYWWVSALLALALVWVEVAAALLISTHTPTVGVGCRALLQIIYGVLSTIPLAIQLILNSFCGTGKHPMLHVWARRWSDVFCLLAVLTLLATTFAAFSGVLKNCTCRGGFNTRGPSMGGYVDFENAEFYRDTRHFDAAKFWYAAAAVGSLPAVVSFFFFVPSVKKLRRLWRNNMNSSQGHNQANGLPDGNAQPNGNGQANGQANEQAAQMPGNASGHIVGGTRHPEFIHTVDMCWLG